MRYVCAVIATALMACSTPSTEMRKADSGGENTPTDAAGKTATDSGGQTTSSDVSKEVTPPDSETPKPDTQPPIIDAGGGTDGTDGTTGGGTGTDATDGTTGTTTPTLIEQSCAKDVECGFANTLEQCVTTMQQLQNSGPPACKSALQSLLQCKINIPDPCQSPEQSECAPLYQKFELACFGGGSTNDIAKQWKKICALFGQTKPENCPEDVDLESVVDFCEFVAEVLSNTPQCLEKVNLYLECAPKMTFHCVELQVIPIPKDPNPCEDKAMPFAFPEGECVGG